MRSFGVLVSLLLVLPCIVSAENKTVVGFARGEARSSTWIAVEAPFLGDDNENGFTVFRIGTSAGGPFTATSSLPAAGPPGWRREVIQGLTPGANYYVQVE